MKLSFFFAWYDFWIGWFYDQKKQVLYICPLPMCVIKVERSEQKEGCDCCGRDNVDTNDLSRVDFTDHKGIKYNRLCNRCFAELGGWDDIVEDVTPEQLDQIIEMAERQFEVDNAAGAVQFEPGLRHYALRQLFFYYEVVMGGGYGD